LLRIYTKKVILFPAGASGHFLSAFLSHDEIIDTLPNFRLDLGQTLSSALFVSGEPVPNGRFDDFESHRCLTNIKNCIVEGEHQTILSHYLKISELREFENTVWIRKIVPITNLFGWIKNIVYKKKYIEQIDCRQQAFAQQVDGCFMDLITWTEINRTDQDRPDDLIIDFGKMYDINYLVQLYESANGHSPDHLRIQFAEEYIRKQYASLHDSDATKMIDIIQHVDPQDPFDIALVLFLFERNHMTIDCNRQWTINDMPNTVTEAVDFLLNNANNYLIFKEKSC
jgi:hypothetical protein